MHPIIIPIKADDYEVVTNLQAALIFLLNKSIYKTYDKPNNPTEEELKRLKEKLQEEQQSGLYGDATKQLIFIFQIQQGLADNFKGEVEEKTAFKLNELLKGLGAFNDAILSPIEKKLKFFKFNFSLDDPQQQEFNQIFIEKNGDWQAISYELYHRYFSSYKIKELELTYQLADWTKDNAQLIISFQNDPNIISLADIATYYTREDFRSLVNDTKAFNEGENATDVADELYDRLLQLVTTELVTNETEKHEINISTLPNGIYILDYFDGKNMKQLKIIKE